jgi:ABC-2 type transport system ATP-binding protein
MAEERMIEVRDLRKQYGETRALRGIGFHIRPGEVVGLLGPNGAGKSTAMKILAGYLTPTSGSARVAGLDVVEQPMEVQKQIGYLPENAPLYGEMLVQEYLVFMSDVRGLDPATRRRRLAEVIGQCAIESVLTRPIGQLSKGYRQRVGLASALIHDPPILILDEPTSGLDPNQIVDVRELIRSMGRTKTVILSTHILPEVEASCARAMILIDGRMRADGDLPDLTRSQVQVADLAPDDPEAARQALSAVPNVKEVESEELDSGFFRFRLHLVEDRAVGEQVAEIVRTHGWPMRELRRDDRSLEQVFRELTESAGEVTA